MPKSSFTTTYPSIAAWLRLDGWIELGPEPYTGTVARTGDEGGMAWSGGDPAAGPDAWMESLEQGIGTFMDEAGFR